MSRLMLLVRYSPTVFAQVPLVRTAWKKLMACAIRELTRSLAVLTRLTSAQPVLNHSLVSCYRHNIGQPTIKLVFQDRTILTR